MTEATVKPRWLRFLAHAMRCRLFSAATSLGSAPVTVAARFGTTQHAGDNGTNAAHPTIDPNGLGRTVFPASPAFHAEGTVGYFCHPPLFRSIDQTEDRVRTDLYTHAATSAGYRIQNQAFSRQNIGHDSNPQAQPGHNHLNNSQQQTQGRRSNQPGQAGLDLPPGSSLIGKGSCPGEIHCQKADQWHAYQNRHR